MPDIIQPKPHYVVLDGLRGIAAFAILIFHYLEIVYAFDYKSFVIGHGFLAVDFFFCLSGFVIGYAYDKRIEKIGVKSFFVNRLVRLHPLVAISTIIGFIGYVADPFVENPIVSGWGSILFAFILSLLMLPAPFLAYRGPALFPYNTPAWSLFFEYLANIIYALVLSRIKRAWLIVVCAASAAALFYCAQRSGWLSGGWGKSSYLDGLARVLFSFTAGLLIFRCQLIIKHNLGFMLPFILLIAAFFYPHSDKDWIAELIIVIAFFPLIVSLGAGAVVTGRFKLICDFIGKLSYPVYMTHIPFVFVFWSYYKIYKPAGWPLIIIISVLIIFSVIFAYGVMRWVEEPIRARLNNLKYKSP